MANFRWKNKIMTQKIIVITGAKGLLGKEFVNHCRGKGFRVIEADVKTETDLDNDQYQLDITSEESVETCIQAIVAKHGRIDGWVNNAYPRTADWGMPDADLPFESWRKNVDMHLNGYYLCCNKIIKQMKQQGFGSIVNLASIYGVQAPDFSIYEGTQMGNAIIYSAIKGGIVNLTRYLASANGQFGIRVNTVSPGGIFDNQNPSFVANYNKKVPLKRMGLPKDIAPSIAFLLSDDAAYITGHNLMVDGGWTIV